MLCYAMPCCELTTNGTKYLGIAHTIPHNPSKLPFLVLGTTLGSLEKMVEGCLIVLHPTDLDSSQNLKFGKH